MEIPGSDPETEVNLLIKDESLRPFDLVRGPLFRVQLFKMSETNHTLLIVMHHIISDGWSMGIFFDELAVLYKSYRNGQHSPLPDLSVQYADFAVWQRQWLTGDAQRFVSPNCTRAMTEVVYEPSRLSNKITGIGITMYTYLVAMKTRLQRLHAL